MPEKQYLCIDLKSFFASVECVDRGLDPMTADLVVADPDRTDKTICLAVSPGLRKKGVKNRCRVFEIPSHLSYIMAPPRMQRYIDVAAEIYGIYIRHVSPQDIHVYSIDEVFLDATPYLARAGQSPRRFANFLMNEVFEKTGVRATAGVGTNLYLAKIALDITAKHSPDFIGELTEESYREKLWDHRPLTDFWRIGPGTAERLARMGVRTQREIAHADPDRLYKAFGIDAELLIDHAWGREPTTIADIKAYKSREQCLCSGQVLMRDYSFEEARLILREMADSLCLELVDQKLLARSIGLSVGYSNALRLPMAAGSAALCAPASADRVLIPAFESLFDRIVSPKFPVRRLSLTVAGLCEDTGLRQLSLFEEENRSLEKNHTVQETVLGIQKRFGKNSVLKGMNLKPAATMRERNGQIGGHKRGD